MKLHIIGAALTLASAGWVASRTESVAAGNSAVSSSLAGKPNERSGSARNLASSMISVVSAAQLVGRDLTDIQGYNSGKIDSLVIDIKSGAVLFVMVTPPRSVGANGQLIALPWALLNRPMTATGPLTTKIDTTALAKAPRIDPRLIFELNRPEQRDRIFGYFGYSDYGSSGAKAPGKDGQNDLALRDRKIDLTHQGAAAPAAMDEVPQPAVTALVVAEEGAISTLEALTTTSAEAIDNSVVYDAHGTEIAAINETMIDVDRGNVAYLLLSHGGFLGMDEKLYVAPIEALTLLPFSGTYRLTANADVLEREPALHAEGQRLPVRVSSVQLTDLYQRFGLQPYWTRGQLGRSIGRVSH